MMKRNMYRQLAVIVGMWLFLPAGSAFAKGEEYPVASIAKSIRENADAVVRLEQRTVVQKDINESTEKVTRVISVFNDRGDGYAMFYLSSSKFTELKSFSGLLLSSTGRVIKKIGRGDLEETQISNDLATDSYHILYSCHAPSYPYTVVYDYEVKHKNGVAWHPYFSPQSFGVGVEKAEYKLTVPANIGVRYKSNEFVNEPVKERVQNDSVYTWSCSDLKAIEREPRCPPLHELCPFVMIAPNDFCMDKICGNMSSWQGTGVFQSQLLQDKDKLLPETAKKVKDLVADAKDEREIVKRLYEHLQQTTRYVSIQLGIGGWMPISADKVAKSGFGDCKALTNYMKAMLREVGIRSIYATIHTDRKDMQEDFSTMFQSNHVLLMVPLKEDSLWLECTSKQSPFNYIHSSMSGHHTLLVNGEESKLCRIKDMTAAENRESSHFDIRVAADGSIASEVKSYYRNQEVERLLNFTINLSERDKVNFLAQRLTVSKPQIGSIQTSYVSNEIPELYVSYRLDAEKYASATGSRLFIPVNPKKTYMRSIFTSAERKQDILLDNVVNSTDSIVFHLPDGYEIESCPKSFALQSDFGTCTCTVEKSEREIRFVYRLHIPVGKYKKEQYKDLRDFFGKIDSGMSGRLVIVPEKKGI